MDINRLKKRMCVFLLAVAASLLIGCAQSTAEPSLPTQSPVAAAVTTVAVPPSDVPAAAPSAAPAKTVDTSKIRMPQASGTVTKEKNGAFMDASHTDQGYVMVRCEAGDTEHKVGISTAEATYYYTLPTDGRFITCPLQMGNGSYTVQVYEHVTGTRYSPLCKWTLEVTLEQDTLPYLYPNQFVDYDATDEAVRLSFTKSADAKTARDKAVKLFQFVADEIDYDYDKAKTVQSGYLPSPDRTLKEKKGICFDYAALLATMLRVQNIPARLQMGQLSPDNVYHAWNLVCIENEWYLLDATMYGQGYQDEDYTASKNY
ncbi:MAG: transglutaminase-like domain-containing protein [Eubacteriales bacterium]|nr:transglutaminase-like domain-containing protein [Eubacteriales bacterium]